MLTERDLAGRVGPVLTDGTPISSLIDLDKREVSMRVLNDPEIHRLELLRVHTRTWCAVAHESEIPNAGDFVLRWIGEDSVIVTRTLDGDVRALLNVCAHRGMEICWADEGNASSFKCPYHGWAFGNDGSLLGAPFEKEMYGDWNKAEYALRTAEVAIRCGVIFANFDHDAEPLDDYMGDMGWYFDQMFGRDFEVSGPVLRSVTPSNWKLAGEQLTGDGYHQATLHKSLGEIGFITADPSDARGWAVANVKVGTDKGHGIIFTESASSVFHTEVDKVRPFDGYFMAGLVTFPATVGIITPFPTPDMKELLVSAAIGGVSPKGAGAHEFWTIPMMPKGLNEQQQMMMRKAGVIGNGVIPVDDNQSWSSVQRSSRGVLGQEQTIKYNTLMGHNPPADWPGPGQVYDGFSKDDNQWHFWLRWFELMTADDR